MFLLRDSFRYTSHIQTHTHSHSDSDCHCITFHYRFSSSIFHFPFSLFLSFSLLSLAAASNEVSECLSKWAFQIVGNKFAAIEEIAFNFQEK